MTGSRKWPATAWRKLLELVLPALDALPADCAWTLGGGTALALELGHRISYDIDLFFENARALRLLSPQRNPHVRALAGSWQEPGHYLKLERPEGAIDFLVGALRTASPTWRYDFDGRRVAVETPAEILAKKLHFRGSRLLVRDIFDLLALCDRDPGSLARAVVASPEGTRRAIDRIERLAGRYRATVDEEVNPTQAGTRYLGADPLAAAAALRTALESPAGGEPDLLQPD